MEQPVEPKQTPQSEPVNNSLSPIEPNVKVEEPQKSSTGISKKVLLLCIIALFVSIALLIGFTMGQRTATTDKAETPVVSQPIVEENEEVTSSALTTLDSEFDYYLMNDCGVAVPKIANYDYKNLTSMDEGRYWNLRVAEKGDEDLVSVGFEGTQSDMQENPMKYANDYGAAYFSVNCIPLPKGLNDLTNVLASINQDMTDANGEDALQFTKVAMKELWGQEVMEVKASDGMYGTIYLVIHGDNYIRIETSSATSSKEVKTDLQAQFNAIVFY